MWVKETSALISCIISFSGWIVEIKETSTSLELDGEFPPLLVHPSNIKVCMIIFEPL